MIKSGEKLIASVGNTLLDLYAKSGSIVDAKKVFDRETLQQFDEMLKSGVKSNEVEPRVEHYVTIVAVLSQAGMLDRAEKFIKEIRIQPTAAVWRTLLGASAGWWRDAAKVRKLMRESEVKKESAYSWVEIEMQCTCLWQMMMPTRRGRRSISCGVGDDDLEDQKIWARPRR
ncbi:Pentatricopeptide repeat [Dillenia turbinata]|uniref:Pentatricopeptide repeat n=1 Tax=Dillenia turbinata TaxID=194707 RepID=A0AAN8VG35_9MAGN